MSESVRYDSVAPFPSVPEAARTKYAAPKLFLRSFGAEAADLDVDFECRSNPHLITSILKCCTVGENGENPQEEFFWDLTVGCRTAAILTTARLSQTKPVTVELCCPCDSCRTRMEIDFTPEDVANVVRRSASSEPIKVTHGKHVIRLRRPTGRDQLRWLAGRHDDQGSLLERMVHSLVISEDDTDVLSGHLSGELLSAVDAAMADADPLIDFRVSVVCPHCDRPGDFECDLEQTSLNQLRAIQIRMLDSVHQIACRYGWSEEEIFALPAWRREAYLKHLEREGAR